MHVQDGKADADAHEKRQENERWRLAKSIAKQTLDEFHYLKLPDLSIGIILLLIGPAFGAMMSKPKFMIYGAWLAISLLLLIIARRVDVHYTRSQIASETPAPTATPAIASTATPTVPLPSPTAAHATDKDTPMLGKSDKAPQTAPPTSSKPPTIYQTAINSPGSVQNTGDNVTINTRPAPRTLTATQKTRLIALLESRPSGKIEILCPPNNVEACRFGSELGEVLKNAGWTLLGVVQNPFGAFPPGLTVLVQSAQNQPPGARELQDALTSIGYVSGGNYHQELPSDRTTLLVGPQPE
jgi:hypothetical protein